MPTINIQIKNIGDIRAAFAQAPSLMVKEADTAIKQSVILVERESRLRTPVATGFLRASHQSRFQPLRAEIEPTAHYAIYVHEGTRKMRSRPFLFQAVAVAEKSIQTFFTSAVQRVLNKIGRDTN